MQAPTRKEDFYIRYQQGEFGNRPRNWSTWSELRDSHYNGLITIRKREVSGKSIRGVCVNDLRGGKIPDGVNLGSCVFNEAMPDDKIVIQGAIYRDEIGLELLYSQKKNIGQQQAVGQFGERARGLKCLALLSLMDPSSRADLDDLLDLYPNAAIEFGTYAVNVGICAHRDTIIWEVREDY